MPLQCQFYTIGILDVWPTVQLHQILVLRYVYGYVIELYFIQGLFILIWMLLLFGLINIVFLRSHDSCTRYSYLLYHGTLEIRRDRTNSNTEYNIQNSARRCDAPFLSAEKSYFLQVQIIVTIATDVTTSTPKPRLSISDQFSNFETST